MFAHKIIILKLITFSSNRFIEFYNSTVFRNGFINRDQCYISANKHKTYCFLHTLNKN